MNRADEADRAYDRVAQAVKKIAVQDPGPEPFLVTYCLHCFKPIERVRLKDLKDGRMVRRFCCVDCRDRWEKGEKFDD